MTVLRIHGGGRGGELPMKRRVGPKSTQVQRWVGSGGGGGGGGKAGRGEHGKLLFGALRFEPPGRNNLTRTYGLWRTPRLGPRGFILSISTGLRTRQTIRQA